MLPKSFGGRGEGVGKELCVGPMCSRLRVWSASHTACLTCSSVTTGIRPNTTGQPNQR